MRVASVAGGGLRVGESGRVDLRLGIGVRLGVRVSVVVCMRVSIGVRVDVRVDVGLCVGAGLVVGVWEEAERVTRRLAARGRGARRWWGAPCTCMRTV